MAAGCARLVHPSVTGEGERRSQRRFIGVMLAAPLLAVGACVALVTASLGADVTLAAIFSIFGLCWFLALLVTATGRLVPTGALALAAAAAGLAGLVAAAGGPASPVMLLAAALPVEAYWVGGSRRAALCGLLAAAAGLAAQFFLAPLWPAAQPAAWHWLVPLAWGATLLPRLGHFRDSASGEDEPPAEQGLEEVIDGVVFRFASNGEVLEGSGKARSVLKLAPELLAGTGLFDRVHLSDRLPYLTALADMREGADMRKVELRIRLPKAEPGAAGDNYRPFVLEFMAVAGQAGAENAFIGLLRENDQLVELRAALAKAREAASGAEVAKSRFLAAVSHELRTPLNAIIGFSDMLLNEMFGGFSDPRQKEYVGLVRDSGHHLLDVVTSILDVSRIEAGAYTAEPEPFHFAEAVEMCRSMMAVQAETRHIELTSNVSADCGEINADRRAVQQILINLASNAIKFTPDGGKVSIGAQRVGSRLHFWVSDTGIGIAEEDLDKLGKPFMQIQSDYTRRFAGTGLGLSLVKGLVALHEGTMSVESAPGRGTRVTISLPVEGPRSGPKEGAGEEKSVVLPLSSGSSAQASSDHAARREARHGPFRKAG
ncbi:HAMP domain-containing sensor histidine kinase [Mesorhizobium sp. SP-1A]|uniref:sensor histidine kinase n=1 Tax=Mesorhizobium sp. SP-1A TaxID=3077840 RepID=UPI0028F6D48C|nr:HAMP domain-containing sensor histidine kinase [Mesorhizobium sp. SP-1A]